MLICEKIFDIFTASNIHKALQKATAYRFLKRFIFTIDPASYN